MVFVLAYVKLLGLILHFLRKASPHNIYLFRERIKPPHCSWNLNDLPHFSRLVIFPHSRNHNLSNFWWIHSYERILVCWIDKLYTLPVYHTLANHTKSFSESNMSLIYCRILRASVPHGNKKLSNISKVLE